MAGTVTGRSGMERAAIGYLRPVPRLRRSRPSSPGLTRRRAGTGWTYLDEDGARITDRDVLQRCRALAVPPAWTEVWICLDADGHLQATGRDDAGRKQYLYHPRWRGIRDATKFHRMRAFGDALPTIRDAVDAHLRRRRFTREKMLALVLALLDETLIRVGNDHYARTNGTFGLTTLEHDHVEITGSRVQFAFVGKSGLEQELEVRHPRLARQLLRCEEIPGQRLFSYEDDDGWHRIESTHVNAYLAEIAGDDLTAKDFRTWGATVVVADALHEAGPAEDEREAQSEVLAAIDTAAARLGNTRAVARSSYVDPRVPKAYRLGMLDDTWDDDPDVVDRLAPAERAVRRVLELDLPPTPRPSEG